MAGVRTQTFTWTRPRDEAEMACIVPTLLRLAAVFPTLRAFLAAWTRASSSETPHARSLSSHDSLHSSHQILISSSVLTPLHRCDAASPSSAPSGRGSAGMGAVSRSPPSSSYASSINPLPFDYFGVNLARAAAGNCR